MASGDSATEPSYLELLGIIGMNGKIKNGLQFHSNGIHFLYPMGDMIIVRNIVKKTHWFLYGHTNSITCLTVSRSGQYVASGQIDHMGFKTRVIIWDFDARAKIGEHSVHKVKVEDVAISPGDRFVASVGGIDDENIIVYSLAAKEPILAVASSSGMSGLPNCIEFSNLTDLMFITGGKDTFRAWLLESESRQVYPFNAQLGYLKREIISMKIDAKDNFVYCGTKTGDILKIRLNTVPSVARPGKIEYQPILMSAITRTVVKKKQDDECIQDSGCFSQGVTAIELLKNGELLIGSGDGTVVQASEEFVMCESATITKMLGNKKQKDIKLNETKCKSIKQGITSLTIRGEGHQFYIGTNNSEIFMFNTLDFSCDLIFTCHTQPIRDIIFPPKTSELFASCGENIRIWNTSSTTELLRICIPNMTCLSLQFSPDGKSIISGWNDGKIRAFTPETGKLIFTIENAHSREVTTIKIMSGGKQLISGGSGGRVRVWDLLCNVQKLKATLVEHRGPITAIAVRKNNLECVSGSLDCSCIIWDLKAFTRTQIIYGSYMILEVLYHPDECQILTCGTDHKISFWETYDGQPLRELEGTACGAVNSIDITQDGKHFVSGGNDKLIKIWSYKEGEQIYLGGPLCADINVVKISPDSKYIICGCEDSSVFIWKSPFLNQK